MAEKITTKGRFYTFAPIYWYSWGLANSVIENEDSRNQKSKWQSDILYFGTLIKDPHNENVYNVKDDEKGWTYKAIDLYKFIDHNQVKEGLPVTYNIQTEPHRRDPYRPFYLAVNIKPRN